MDPASNDIQLRQVSVETLQGPVEGVLRISSMLRTLDDLNMGRSFLTVHEPRLGVTGWSFRGQTLAINKHYVVCLRELSDPPRSIGKPMGGQFTRAAIRLRVAHFDIEGFLHVPPGGAPIARLNQGPHAFISLTSASVVGSDTEFASPFLAINRHHILAAQELDPGRGEPEVELSFEVAE